LVFSCYCTPRWNDERFNQFPGGLEDSIVSNEDGISVLVVGGDFNAHSAEWGSSTDDVRGGLLSDFATGAGLVTCNVGTTPTFSRVNARSVVDVSFVRMVSCVTIAD